MHLTVRQTLSRAHTHTQADTPDKHQNVTKLHPDSECHRDTYLYFIMLPSSPETHLRSKRACRYSESSHLPSNNSVFHCRAADAVFSPSSRSPLSLLRLPHCFFSLSLPFSLFLSPSLIDSPFPSAALLPLVMRIVSDIFRWMEPLVDSEGMGYTAGTVFL